jgi:hypothetical protein
MYNGEVPSTVWVIKIGENPAVAYMNQFTAMHNVIDFVNRKLDEAITLSEDITRIKELVALRPHLKRCKCMKELRQVLTDFFFGRLPLGPISLEEADLDF